MTKFIEIDKLNRLDIVKKLNSLLSSLFRLNLYFFSVDESIDLRSICKSGDICRAICSSKHKTEWLESLKKDIKKAIKTKGRIFHNHILKTDRIIIPVKLKSKIYGVCILTQRGMSNERLNARLKLLQDETQITKLKSKKDKVRILIDFLESFVDYIFTTRFEEIVFSSSQASHSHLQESIKRAVEYINENYYKPDISLNEVSKAANLSPYYFSHQFKNELETTFIDYLTKVRIEAAVELLKDLRLSIAQVSFAVGYQDPNYFSKVFKKYVNISPAEFREQFAKQKVS